MAFPTLASKYDHEVLGNEYCSGYTDLFNKWNTGFYCPQTGSSLAVYCCGTPVYKYCCTNKPPGSSYGSPTDSESDMASLHFSDTPVIIAIACGIVAVVILVIVSSCFFCSCCFVHKKRSNVPGMYRMENSSQTSGLTSYHPTQSQTQTSSQNQNQSESVFQNNSLLYSDGHIPQHSRPIISIQPQQMTRHNNSNIGVARSNSLSSNTNPVDFEWSEPHLQSNVFHINNNHPSGISSNHNQNHNQNQSILPPPARFASNQNLSYTSSGNMSDRSSNPREIQKNFGAPYTLTSAQQHFPHQYQPNTNYCTSTLPSCLRRTGSRDSQGQQPLKSILRNPLTMSQSVTYRRATEDFDFCDALLPQNTCVERESPNPNLLYNNGGIGGRPPGSGSGSDEHSYGSYGYEYNRPFTPDPGPSPNSYVTGRRYSNPNTEYQNDLNRLGRDLDPESLSRLIELDLDSKL